MIVAPLGHGASGDEKSFALTRQCRCIPIVATQSISSLRPVLGSSEAWRSLLQTLRTRIFLSLSDDASAKIASELCGQVAKMKGSYTISETSKRPEVSRSQAGPVEVAVASARPNHSGSNASRCFIRETSPCLGTVKHLSAL